MNKYIGVDLGTSSSKFLLVDIEGNVDKQCSRSYPVFYPQDGWSEQDPSLWIEVLISGVKELTCNEDINEIKGKEIGEVSSYLPIYYAFDTLHTLTTTTKATFRLNY